MYKVCTPRLKSIVRWDHLPPNRDLDFLTFLFSSPVRVQDTISSVPVIYSVSKITHLMTVPPANDYTNERLIFQPQQIGMHDKFPSEMCLWHPPLDEPTAPMFARLSSAGAIGGIDLG
jgi:hypothetical protein